MKNKTFSGGRGRSCSVLRQTERTNTPVRLVRSGVRFKDSLRRTQAGGIPVFTVERTGGTLWFVCPRCGARNVHGAVSDIPGAGDGHRASHCPCWPRGYYLVERKGCAGPSGDLAGDSPYRDGRKKETETPI